jgi:predicted nuclease of predicted toxin-antitoxin system
MNNQHFLSDKVRFFVDKSAGSDLANALRACGYDAKCSENEGPSSDKDEDVFLVAWKDRRVLVTCNPEFLDNHRFPPTANPGVIVLEGDSNRNDERVVRCVVRALRLSANEAAWFEGKKLDFSSTKALTITSPGSRHRFVWKRCA